MRAEGSRALPVLQRNGEVMPHMTAYTGRDMHRGGETLQVEKSKDSHFQCPSKAEDKLQGKDPAPIAVAERVDRRWYDYCRWVGRAHVNEV